MWWPSMRSGPEGEAHRSGPDLRGGGQPWETVVERSRNGKKRMAAYSLAGRFGAGPPGAGSVGSPAAGGGVTRRSRAAVVQAAGAMAIPAGTLVIPAGAMVIPPRGCRGALRTLRTPISLEFGRGPATHRDSRQMRRLLAVLRGIPAVSSPRTAAPPSHGQYGGAMVNSAEPWSIRRNRGQSAGPWSIRRLRSGRLLYRAQVRWRPPSTGIVTPVTKPASSESRKRARSATSSGVPMRPMGWVVRLCSTKAA